jgi:cysteine desulfurase
VQYTGAVQYKGKRMPSVYLDNNATTQLLPEVFEAMRPYFFERFGNASSLYERGQRARAAVEKARNSVAALLGADPAEVVFNSGGTEGDNQAIAGLVSSGDHVITSVIEHPAALNACKRLETTGVTVTYLPVDGHGQVNPADVQAALQKNTKLISVMMANNETGVIQPLEEIGRIAAEADVWFHTDAVQAAGKLPIDVARIQCDLLSISGHKLNAPQGIGALYVRRGTPMQPLIVGGPQEHNKRGGTENLPGIVGLGEAAEIASHWLADGGADRMGQMRDAFERTVGEQLECIHIHGLGAPRTPNTSDISFDGISGGSLMVALDGREVSVSTGSACASGSSHPPYVLMAMGVKRDQAHAAVRFSLGKQTTPEEMDYVLACLSAEVAKLRKLSPVWNNRNKKKKSSSTSAKL